MGTTVIGGMVAASFLGIFLVPAIFYAVERLSGVSQSRRPMLIEDRPVAGD
jgi:HAE1 family hydrophobic/amphiphilic exporter-1